ncbi:MAG: molybdopterin-dependent oxidoreductase [Myxococcota bacterium]
MMRTKSWPDLGRRRFIHCSLCSSMAGASIASTLAGCSDDEPLGMPSPDASPDAGGPDSAADATPDATGPECTDPFANGTMLGAVPFINEDIPLNQRLGQGWDGRLYTDLSNLDGTNFVVNNDEFYIRTFYPDRLVPPADWTIQVGGLVDGPASIRLADLLPQVVDQGVHVLECSGNGPRGGFGLMSSAQWAGIPIMDVLDRIQIQPAATRVLISGFDDHSVPSAGNHSTPGAAWIFTFEELAAAGAFLATEMNGVPLPPDHGDPVRLYVPGWYGCTCIKWVNEIRLVDDDEPATSQMMEFATRTHQTAIHALARDYLPASMDQAAMPIRVEKWNVEGQIVYRLVGVMWGGYEPTSALGFSSGRGDFTLVDTCPPQTQNATWTMWQHAWRPSAVGEYRLLLSVDDPAIPTRRLDSGFYAREVFIDEV